MRTDVAVDKLCLIVPYLCDIADKANTDAELHKAIEEGRKSTDKRMTTQLRFLAQVIGKCKDEVFEILSVVYDKTVDEVKEQDFMSTTIPQVIKLWNNPDIQAFFTKQSPKQTVEQTVEEEAEEELSTTSEPTLEETEAQGLHSSPFAGF